ncbi:ATP-dependent DNA ligase [Fodinibius roseus]|uniref:ATP-dependent DNA ligase n=1 Tax=Fodinibius roseus TaxID=1194090 RepID=A0A1M4XU82_9BACT|nr:hypothetical protein [Fodinibius roseus]SHE97154.1 ATP-dependent DNA ligase [Fodinibius roseus]
MSDTFRQWAEAVQQIAEAPDTPVGITRCATYLRSLRTDKGLQLAARFLDERIFPFRSGKRVAVGSRTYSTCAAEFCEIDYEQVFKPCKKALGNAPDTIEKLMQNIEAARDRRSSAGLSLSDIRQNYERLSGLSTRTVKKTLLKSAWRKMTPVEINYYIRLMRGALETGLSSQQLASALAEAFERDPSRVRHAVTITGRMGRTALLCKHDKLEEARFFPFHPLPPMSASPAKEAEAVDLTRYVAEEEFAGLRTQVHLSGNRVKLYASDGTEVTGPFPDVTHFFLSRPIPDVVLDGVICAYRDREILPGQLLRKRMKMKKKRPGADMLEQYPALFIAFDILYHKGELISGKSLSRRRQILEKLSENHSVPIASQFDVRDRDHLKKLFIRSLSHGNEGLVLKLRESAYETYGQPSDSWINIIKPAGSLKTVLMYVHTENGKHGRRHTGYTLGVRVREDPRYEEEFIPIGKSGADDLGDEETKRLKKRIRDLTVEKYGPTLGLIPEIVVELEFDDIRLNKRTKANYVLHRPRFSIIRWNSDPVETATLKKVENLYQKKINQNRLKQDENPSFLIHENYTSTKD